MKLDLSYDVEVDTHGVVDGRELARQLIVLAYKLVIPYVEGCPACSDNLFTVITNEMIETLHDEGREAGGLNGVSYFTVSDDEAAEAKRKHYEDATAETRRLLAQVPHDHSHDADDLRS